MQGLVQRNVARLRSSSVVVLGSSHRTCRVDATELRTFLDHVADHRLALLAVSRALLASVVANSSGFGGVLVAIVLLPLVSWCVWRYWGHDNHFGKAELVNRRMARPYPS